VRISGSQALAILQQATGCDYIEPRIATVLQWTDRSGDVLDEGIVLFFPGPHSYTGEDVIELQGHGSPVLLRALLERLYQLGCRPADPGEFTRRAVENGKIELSQAEAVAACIDAATVRAGKQALRQLQGAFGKHIEDLMQKLTGLVAHVEASLDFPEEEIPPLFFEHLAKQVQQSLITPIESLLATAPLGERLFDGAVVAIIGAPNVGKSSLLNALAGRDRAIVSEVAGTTRDVLEIDFEVHGIPVRLADTAGLRSTDDAIEREGVRRAEVAAAQADAVIFVADASRPDSWTTDKRASLFLMNKTDLVEPTAPAWPDHFIPVSIKQGRGLNRIGDVLARQLGDMETGDEGVLVTRERHRTILLDTLSHLQAGLRMLHAEDQLDLTAMEWRSAWGLLGGILGIGDVEYILDRVFSEFCVGK